MPKYRIEISPFGGRSVTVVDDANAAPSELVENAGVPHRPGHRREAERLVSDGPGVPGHLSVGSRVRVPLGDLGHDGSTRRSPDPERAYRPGNSEYDAEMTSVLSDIARLKARVGELERRLEAAEQDRRPPGAPSEPRAPGRVGVPPAVSEASAWFVGSSAPRATSDEPSWFDRPAVSEASAEGASDAGAVLGSAVAAEEPVVRPPEL